MRLRDDINIAPGVKIAIYANKLEDLVETEKQIIKAFKLEKKKNAKKK